MDEFKPEDELKPDTSDRRPQRSRKTSSVPKVSVSRQHIMMGIGILVLLLLVLGIGSALNRTGGSSQQPSSQPGNAGGNDKTIDLSGSSSMSGQPAAQQPAPDATAAEQVSANPPVRTPEPAVTGNSPQVLSAPPVSSTPTQAAPVPTPTNQQRVELPGDLNNALTNQQGQVDNVAHDAQNNSGSLPTTPATVAPGAPAASNKPVTGQSHQAAARPRKPAGSHRSVATQPVRENKSSSVAAGHTASAAVKAGATSLPGGSYTLQLSSASRADTLNAWAKKQDLNSYHVYKTTRNGQPWFVLVSGSYATPAEAKRAVSSLPAEVQAKKPWVKPLSQVKKEASN